MPDLAPHEHPCAKCGAALPVALGEREVTCRFCSARQPNPEPLVPGTEVVVGDGAMPKMGRVLSCNGPDAILLENERNPRHLDDLMPVVVAREDELLPRTVIYAMLHVGWYRTTLVRVDSSGMAIVKMQEQAFQDSFFDKKISLDLVRLPLRARDRRRPTRGAMLKERFLGDPFGFLVSNIVNLVFIGFFLLIAVPIVWILLSSLFRH